MRYESLNNLNGTTLTQNTITNPDWVGSSSAWDRVLSWLAFLALASYLLFYVLVPDAYAFGPSLVLLLALLVFRWKKLLDGVDRESLALIGVLWLFFLMQALTLTLHGEDVSEFDLSTRYVAASLVMLFVLKYAISARWFFLFGALGALMAGAYGIYQAEFQGIGRVTAFDNPIHYGNGAMALALIAFSGFVWAAKQTHRRFWLAILILGSVGGIYASLVSGTRSGWIAFPVIALIGLYVFRQPLIKRKLILVLLTIMIAAGLVAASQFDLVERRMTIAVNEFIDYYEDGRNGTSVGLRLDMWKAGVKAFQENPLIGSGPTGTEAVISDLIVSGQIHPAVQNFRHLHNQYIDVMARYGVIGLASYLLLMVVTFGLFLKKTNSDVPEVKALALGGAFFVTLHAVVNLTQSMLERNIGVTMFVFMVVFIWAVLKREEARQIESVDTV
ncbi:O-antigen ligase family protein [Marinobacter sp. HN1S83]